MTKQQMEEFLINNNEDAYYETNVEFPFGGSIYETTINFAYFNWCLDEILNKRNIPHDESWMMLKSFTKSNYNKFMDMIVKKLYNLKVGFPRIMNGDNHKNEVQDPQDIIMDILTLTNKMINFFNSKKKISLDKSLLSVMDEASKNKKLEDMLMNRKIDTTWTPEKIIQHRKENIKFFKENNIPGVTELLLSEYGIKDDQMVNIYGGIDLVPRIHNMHEMFPVPIDNSWLNGIKGKEQFFIFGNINVYALFMSKTVIQRAGVINKDSAMIAQDTSISDVVDCGSKTPVEYFVPDEKALETLEFRYMVKDDGTLEEITRESKHLIGKYVKIRSAYTCCCEDGNICQTCFGSNVRWNLPTEEYNRDLGVELTKLDIANIAQNVLSTKHNTAPKLIEYHINYLKEGDKKEKALNRDDNEFFKREFNKFIWKDDVKVYLDKSACENPLFETRKEKAERKRTGRKYTEEEIKKKPIHYIDGEFGDNDIVRASSLIVEKDGIKYTLLPNSFFKISGLPSTTFKIHEEPRIIEVTNNEITHVIRNDAKALKFFDIEDLYAITTETNRKISEEEFERNTRLVSDYKEFIGRVDETFPRQKKIVMEIVFRNKIRDKNDEHKIPDWKSDNPEAIVLTSGMTISAIPSLSLKIASGAIRQRLNDPFYHDPKNLRNTSYDRMYDDNKY